MKPLRMEAVFCLKAENPLNAAVRTGCHHLFTLAVSPSVCHCVCVTLVVFTDRESCTRPISTNPEIYNTQREWSNAWDVFRRAPSRGGRGRRAAVDSVVCFESGGFFVFFFFRSAFSLQTDTTCCKYGSPCLSYLYTSTW